MTDILVTSPYQPFTLPNQFKAVFNGYIYCGTVDAVDPSVSQVQVYLANEDGSRTPVAQPLRTNAGGYLVYNGQPARFVTGSNHSLLVRDSLGAQVWYEPDMAMVDPQTLYQIVDIGLRADLASPGGAGFVSISSIRTLADMVADCINVKNYSSISAAIAAMGSKSILFFPEGEYTWDLPPVSRDIIIIGQSAPMYNYDTNETIGGVVIKGKVQLTGNNVTVKNVGVRRPDGSPGECLLITSAALNSGKQATVENVVACGISHSDAYHSVLVQGYSQANIHQVSGGYNRFGLAIKSKNVLASNILTANCETGVIIKADASSGKAERVTLSNHRNIGGGVCKQGAWILSADEQMEKVILSNLMSTDSEVHLQASSSTLINDIVVNGVNYTGSTVADIVLTSDTVIKILNVGISAGSLSQSTKFLSSARVKHLTVSKVFGALKSGAEPLTSFDVEDSVDSFTGSDITLTQAYNSTPTDYASMRLMNDNTGNAISNIKAKIAGNGLPNPGYRAVSLTTAGATLTIGNCVFGRGTAGVSSVPGGQYTAISGTDYLGQAVPVGFVLTILNIGSNAFNIANTASIVNIGGATKTPGVGQSISYTHLGSGVWSQTPFIS